LANNLRHNPEFAYRETQSKVIDVLAEIVLKYIRSFTNMHQTRNVMHVFKALSENCEK
jgi:hypothetical protein